MPDRCPMCSAELATCAVTPCMDCGANPRERAHMRAHRYHEYELFPGLRLVLCDFCDADFPAYNPKTFGPRCTETPDPGLLGPVREISDVSLTQDRFCPVCQRRLAFLRFLADARALHG